MKTYPAIAATLLVLCSACSSFRTEAPPSRELVSLYPSARDASAVAIGQLSAQHAVTVPMSEVIAAYDCPMPQMPAGEVAPRAQCVRTKNGLLGWRPA
jgi:hypothetical protein